MQTLILLKPKSFRQLTKYDPALKPSAGRFSVISDLGVSLLGRAKNEFAEVNILGKPVLFMIKDVRLAKKQPKKTK